MNTVDCSELPLVPVEVLDPYWTATALQCFFYKMPPLPPENQTIAVTLNNNLELFTTNFQPYSHHALPLYSVCGILDGASVSYRNPQAWP